LNDFLIWHADDIAQIISLVKLYVSWFRSYIVQAHKFCHFLLTWPVAFTVTAVCIVDVDCV